MSVPSQAIPLAPSLRTAGRQKEVGAERGFSIPSLDGIRAAAVMIVFIGHCGLGHVIPGGFGVTVFFFLSGYLITTLLRREYEKTGGISLRAFYLRRIYRIFPPMYLVLGILMALALSGVLSGVAGEMMSPVAILAQAAHFTNYYLIAHPPGELAPVVPYSGVMWSLAVEEHFYLLFPLSLLLLWRKGYSHHKAALVLAAACAAVLAWRIFLSATLEHPGHWTYHASDSRVDSILFGCIMALWYNPALDPAPKGIGSRGWAALCVLGLAAIAGAYLYRSPAFRDTLRYTVVGIALFPLFWCAVKYATRPAFAWLNLRPVRALGIVSYTFYLAHFAIIDLTGRIPGVSGFAQALLAFAFTAAFSAACYVLVEKRFAVLRRQLHGATA